MQIAAATGDALSFAHTAQVLDASLRGLPVSDLVKSTSASASR
jgi:hypothetical protein